MCRVGVVIASLRGGNIDRREMECVVSTVCPPC